MALRDEGEHRRGADSGLTQTHALVTTPANAATDVTRCTNCCTIKRRLPSVKRRRKARWRVALRPNKRRALPSNRHCRIAEHLEQLKASVRAKVEHPFHIIKSRFGLKRAHYRVLHLPGIEEDELTRNAVKRGEP